MSFDTKDLNKHLLNSQKVRSIKEAVNSEEMAKLGDSFINFLYSISKSLALGSLTGMKVPDSVLANAYRSSKWNSSGKLSLRGKKDQVGDGVEALILYYWLNGKISFSKMVALISENLVVEALSHHRSENKTSSNAFKILLDYAHDLESEPKVEN